MGNGVGRGSPEAERFFLLSGSPSTAKGCVVDLCCNLIDFHGDGCDQDDIIETLKQGCNDPWLEGNLFHGDHEV